MTLEAVLGTRNRVRVLRALFETDGVSLRQVSARAGIVPSAGKAALSGLIGAGVVLRTNRRSSHCYEVNRSHYLFPSLRRLFGEESRLPARLAEAVRRQLRDAQPPREVIAVGLSESRQVTLAVLPGSDDALHSALEARLRFEFGLRLRRMVSDPSEISATERVWGLETRPGRGLEPGPEDRDRALRFFGVRGGDPARDP